MRTCPAPCLIASVFSFAVPFAESCCFPVPCVQPSGCQGISHEGVDSTGAGKRPGDTGTRTQTWQGPWFLPSPAACWGALGVSVCPSVKWGSFGACQVLVGMRCSEVNKGLGLEVPGIPEVLTDGRRSHKYFWRTCCVLSTSLHWGSVVNKTIIETYVTIITWRAGVNFLLIFPALGPWHLAPRLLGPT